MKIRIDILVHQLGLAPSRERAQAYIMAGKVLVNEQRIEKPGVKVNPDHKIRVIGQDHPFVSRGGLKLHKALNEFNLDVKNVIAMDVGASTGGFTDCLIKNEASFVFAIDVGYGQLAWELVTNQRVKNLERTHFIKLKFSEIGTFVDFITVDVSFISLNKILDHCRDFLKKNGIIIALIKPQFEAGKEHIEKRGIVKDAKIHHKIINDISSFAQEKGFIVKGLCKSPIHGKKSGNVEFLIYLEKK